MKFYNLAIMLLSGMTVTSTAYADPMCAELTGDFYLGDSMQPTCKSPLPLDSVS